MPINRIEDAPRAWRALLICPNAQMREAAEAALATVEMRELVSLNAYPGLWEVSSLVEGFDICLLDGTSDASLALRLLTKITSTGISVIVLLSRADSDLSLQCLRRGASQVTTFSEGKGELQSALDNVAARKYYSSQGTLTSGVVYGVMAGKGGSGSTTAATNLAIRLAQARPRRTLLIDLDGITGDVALLLQQEPVNSILDVADALTRLDENLFRKIVATAGPLDVLLAPAKPMPLQIPGLLPIMEFCRSLYDCVILDLPRNYFEFYLGLPQMLDLLVLVTTPELSSVHSTIRAISYLENSGVPSTAIKVVLNRYSDAGIKSNSVPAALGRKVFAHLADSEKVRQGAMLWGSSIRPSPAYSSDMASIAQKLTNWPIPISQKDGTKFGPAQFLKKICSGSKLPNGEAATANQAANSDAYDLQLGQPAGHLP